MNPVLRPASENFSAPRPFALAIVGKALLHGLFLLIAVVAFGAHEHFKLQGQSASSLASLLAAAGFGLAPVRALARVLLAIEGKALHLVHGVGGLALLGLTVGGVVSGGLLLTHAALAPFAIMGAAQAVMHQDHPRNPEQAGALPELRKRLAQARKTVDGE